MTDSVTKYFIKYTKSYNFLGIPIGGIRQVSDVVSAFTELGKLGVDISYKLQDCDAIPFNKIKEVFGEKLHQINKNLDKNFNAIHENLQAIHKNYAAIITLGGKIDRNLKAIEFGFDKIA